MIIIIDHFDSFVHTLARYVRECGFEVAVLRQDIAHADTILTQNPEAIIFSPGPGHPRETGISREILKQAPQHLPMLGVCLGHQLIAHHFGAEIDEHPPCHGRASPITHDNDPLFTGLPNPFMAGRYHALIAEQLPPCLSAIGWGLQGEIMAIRHTERPIVGVQFHPESILTPEGHKMISNFLMALK